MEAVECKTTDSERQQQHGWSKAVDVNEKIVCSVGDHLAVGAPIPSPHSIGTFQLQLV